MPFQKCCQCCFATYPELQGSSIPPGLQVLLVPKCPFRNVVNVVLRHIQNYKAPQSLQVCKFSWCQNALSEMLSMLFCDISRTTRLLNPSRSASSLGAKMPFQKCCQCCFATYPELQGSSIP